MYIRKFLIIELIHAIRRFATVALVEGKVIYHVLNSRQSFAFAFDQRVLLHSFAERKVFDVS